MSNLAEKQDENHDEDLESLESEETLGDDFEYSLTYYGVDFDVSGLIRRFENGSIFIPDFQRSYVWDKKRASKFIESLLMGIPVPGIFLYRQENDEKMLIIDGLQRLSTLKAFYDGSFKGGGFKLSGVHKKYEKKSYEELAPEEKRKLDDIVIHATIIKAEDPVKKNSESVYLIFERLNTGGVNLTPQEIRNSIYRGDFLNLLIELSKAKDFVDLLGPISQKDRRKHEEVCLRLIALNKKLDSYNGKMKWFLNDFMEANRNFEVFSESDIRHFFIKTLDFMIKNIGIKILRGDKTINTAILDAIFVGVSLNIDKIDRMNENEVEKISNQIKTNIESLRELGSKATRTTQTEAVKGRIKFIDDLIKKEIR